MNAVTLQRTIAAPPDEVYRTWLEPDLIQRWMAPGDLEATRVEVDARVGGAYRVWHGDAGGFEAEILELVPGERIAFRWGFVGPDRLDGPVYDSLLTVTLRQAAGGGTELTLVHERLEALRAAMPDVADSVGYGWASALDKLATAAPPSAR
ncbi:MAG TPA: SRPBCC domain-containing protein [Solirubrobacteraceae bacterium]|nr:SRPBCC domain-containing protein [Solirubrobacteraceae bacterium]